MSKKIVQLNEEVIKGQLKELVRGSVEETLNELLEQEAEKLTQAARYERSEARQGYRSGHYDRNLTTTSYKIAICDDEKQVRESIRDMLGRYATENGCTFQCALFDSATSLLRDYRADLDILFLDISMQGLDGMDAAREIRKRDDRVCIIFVTSMYQYAIEGYSVHAFGFVTKPMHYQELSMELDSALRAIDGARLRETAITLRSGTQIDRLPVSGILYCEVRNHTVAVHLYGEIRSYRYSMKEMETMLGQYGFFRPHSAYLVNHAAIAQVLGFRLMLKNGEELPISQQRRKAFLSDLTGYIG